MKTEDKVCLWKLLGYVLFVAAVFLGLASLNAPEDWPVHSAETCLLFGFGCIFLTNFIGANDDPPEN